MFQNDISLFDCTGFVLILSKIIIHLNFKPMKKILVPTDFSKPAMIAAEVAADIAKKANAELTLLHVVEEAVGNSLNVEGQVTADGRWEERLFTMKLIEKAKKQLTKLVEDPKFEGIRVKQELRIGSPYHGMNTIITERKVDLVVMGTAGHSELEQMIIGSNTEKIVRRSHCPVLTMHAKPA